MSVISKTLNPYGFFYSLYSSSRFSCAHFLKFSFETCPRYVPAIDAMDASSRVYLFSLSGHDRRLVGRLDSQTVNRPILASGGIAIKRRCFPGLGHLSPFLHIPVMNVNLSYQVNASMSEFSLTFFLMVHTAFYKQESNFLFISLLQARSYCVYLQTLAATGN